MTTRLYAHVAKTLREVAAQINQTQDSYRYRMLYDHLQEMVEKARAEGTDHARLSPGGIDMWQAWYAFYRSGRVWSAHILDKVAIPPRSAKAFEMASRVFNTSYPKYKGPKPNVAAWFDKNKARFQLLLEAEQWPDRSADDAQEGGIFRQDKFTVHDTIGASAKDIESAKEMLELATKYAPKTGLPGFEKVLYGDVYLVGNIANRKNWIAWYIEAKDSIYLRPNMKGRVLMDSVKTLLHELGHRYWRKHVSHELKSTWAAHHRQMLQGPSREFVWPEVGQILPFMVNGKKNVSVLKYRKGTKGLLVVDIAELADQNGNEIAQLERRKLREWMQEAEVKATFPSSYAATTPEEHFSEALAYKALGKLSKENEAAFDRIFLS